MVDGCETFGRAVLLDKFVACEVLEASDDTFDGSLHMRTTTVAGLLGMLLVLASCGGGKTTSSINGHWAATLQNPNGTAAFGFSARLTQNSGTSVAVSNFVFTSSGSCFSSQMNESATFSATENSNGLQTGPFGMTITSQGSQSNVLTIQGNLQSNSTNESITGAWSLTGAVGCSGGGTFVMNPLPPV